MGEQTTESETIAPTRIKVVRLPRRPGFGTISFPRGSKRLQYRQRDHALVMIGPETTEEVRTRVLVIREGDRWPIDGESRRFATPENLLGSWFDKGFDYHAFHAGPVEG